MYLSANPQYSTDETLARVNRLKGLLDWNVHAEYDERLTEAYKNLHELDDYIKRLNKLYQSFIRTRQAATQSYEGYQIPIRRLRTRLQANELRVKGLMARQGRMLEMFAVNELERRKQRLEEYQIKSAFCFSRKL